VGVSTALFFTALLLHAWVGGRDVLLDYIHAARIRFVSLAGLALGLIALGFWVIHILYSVR
jgi:succinate dehydrogenase / fumarate reductase membrane anchor subunit